MGTFGCDCGLWSPCIFQNEKLNMLAYAYGDNFVTMGRRDLLYTFSDVLKQRMWLKHEGVLGQDQSVGMSGRSFV